MKPAERHIDITHSDFVIHTPSAIARRTFLYVLRAGEFSYEAGYQLTRSSFDSFLVMYVCSGSLEVELPSGEFHAAAGQFVILDCYVEHAYRTQESTKVIWMHFDGVMARPYYNLIIGKLTNVFSLRNPHYATNRLKQIQELLTNHSGFSEARMSKFVTDILSEFAGEQEPGASQRQSQVAEDAIAYISGHLNEPLGVEELAARSYLSEFHFIRVFKNETGTTPHAYIIDARIHAAKYMLVNSNSTMKTICSQCGFSSTSVFCAAFKRSTGVSPLEYRRQNRGNTQKEQYEKRVKLQPGNKSSGWVKCEET